MANLNTWSFSSLVSNFATAVQGVASRLVDFTVGSTLRAIDEAVSFVALWLQGLIIQVGALTRAATSNGTDLDSWFAQFGFSRLPAVAATMQETFGRFTASAQALVYPGASVQSQDGSVVFLVVVDTTNPNWNASLGAYVLPINTLSIAVTVQCAVTGSSGNVSANAINSMATAISGVDYVNNAFLTQNGIDPETDTAARARFITYIASLQTGTLIAIGNAIAGVQAGMIGVIAENTQFNGSAQNGYFTAIINNGAGTATSTQLINAGNAIEAARPLTITYGVHAASPLTVNVSMTMTAQSGYTHSAVAALIQTAVANYIASRQVTASGGTCSYLGVGGVSLAVPGVATITSLLLNGAAVDVTATWLQGFVAGTITVN